MFLHIALYRRPHHVQTPQRQTPRQASYTHLGNSLRTARSYRGRDRQARPHQYPAPPLRQQAPQHPAQLTHYLAVKPNRLSVRTQFSASPKIVAIFQTTNSVRRATPNRIQAGSQSWRLQVRRPPILLSSLFEFRPDLRAGDCRSRRGRSSFAACLLRCTLRSEFPADSSFAGSAVDNTKFTPGRS